MDDTTKAQLNEAFLALLENADDAEVRAAQQALNDYTLKRMCPHPVRRLDVVKLKRMEGQLTRHNFLEMVGAVGEDCEGCLVVYLVMNRVTALDVLKWCNNGPYNLRDGLPNEDQSFETTIEHYPTTIVRDRELVPDDQVRVLGSNGVLYIFDFVT